MLDIDKIKERIANESPEEIKARIEKILPPKPGIPVHIELNDDDKLDRCPRCGSKVKEEPQPSLHLASTIYECDTEVITTIDSNPTSWIDLIGHKCREIVEKKHGLVS